ncbi:MAG: glycosyltransferase family 2 protein [Eubacteriales bacterium]|jgi:glycosyltransferase involved in cell wall biosynthesis
MPTKLYIVIPCYNEQEVLPETARRLRAKMDQLLQAGTIHPDSHVIFVDDGSKDQTWPLICSLHEKDPLYRGIKLTRNRGHQNALLCGLMTVRREADAVISMDADLQDDIDAIDGFVKQYQEGCDVVYGVRSQRTTDTFFKRFTADGFYKLMKSMGVELVFNHADYRLMSRRALEGLSQFKEVNLFLRGMVPMVGYRTGVVTYARNERFAGESKYPLKKMLAFAFQGITSLSVKPIRLITGLGALLAAGGLLTLLWQLITRAGLTPVIAASVWLLGGLQLLAIGIVGEYVGKIYLETKARPRYLVEQYLGGPQNPPSQEGDNP